MKPKRKPRKPADDYVIDIDPAIFYPDAIRQALDAIEQARIALDQAEAELKALFTDMTKR